MSDSEGLAAEVGSGDRRRGLEALRDVLARTITEAEPGQVAALAGRLAAVMAELDQFPSSVAGASAQDQLKERRAKRLAGAATGERAAERK